MSRRNEEFFVKNYIPLSPDDFYTKSKLQDVLCRPSQYFANVEIKNFDIIYHDLHQKKMDQALEHYQTITKDRFKDFDWATADYCQHLHVERKGTICFLRKTLIVSFFWKKIHIFFCLRWRKKFIIKKLKITTTNNTKLNF